MKVLVPITILVVLALAACSNTTTTATTKPAPGVTSSEMEQSIKARIESDPQLSSANLKVSADADKNEATLSGTVWTEAMRTEAVSMAKTARPGVTVNDKIDVKPGEIPRSAYTEGMSKEAREQAKSAGEKIGTSLDDAWIHSKVVAKLVGDSKTPARKINVDVVNGMVTLRGIVESPAAKAEAGRVATETDGVKRVTNLLKVNVG